MGPYSQQENWPLQYAAYSRRAISKWSNTEPLNPGLPNMYTFFFCLALTQGVQQEKWRLSFY